MGAGASIEDSKARIKAAFTVMDADSSGNIDPKEIAAVLAGSNLSEAAAARQGQVWFDRFNVNKDRKVDCAEFEAFFEKTLTEHGEEATLNLLVWFEELNQKLLAKRAAGGSFTESSAASTTAPAATIHSKKYNHELICKTCAVTDKDHNNSVDAREIAELLRADSKLSEAGAAKAGKDFFDQINRDRDNKVDAAEFEAFFDRHLASYGEADNNALIDWFAELAEKLEAKRGQAAVNIRKYNHDLIYKAFAVTDKDHSNSIDAGEIAELLECSEELSKASCAKAGMEFFNDINTNKDNKVDVSEFEAYFERHLAAHGEAENNLLIDWFADLAKKLEAKRNGPTAPAVEMNEVNKKIIFETFAIADANSDGSVDAKEIAALLENTPLSKAAAARQGMEWFERFDTNDDRKVDVAEFEAFFASHLAEYGVVENDKLVDWFHDLAHLVADSKRSTRA